MNVAIFTDNDLSQVNGVTTSVRAILRYAPPDVQARVYTCDGIGLDTPDCLALRSLGLGIPYAGGTRMYWPRFRRLLSEAVRDAIDVIHLTTPGPVGLAALFVAWRTGLPLIGTFHTDLASYARILSGSARLGALIREYVRWPYSCCRRVFVASEATYRMLAEARFNPATLAVWRLGVDAELFTPARRSASLRDRWQVSGRRPAVIYVGRISREKGVERLAALEATLRRWQPVHRLVVVGDGPARRDLEAACPDAVFTGTLPRVGVAEAMASADLFVFPSETDSAGNVVLEAQAAGLPVIVMEQGGPKEYVRDGVTGLVCGTYRDLLARTAALVSDETVRCHMGRAAREHARGLRWEPALAPLYAGYWAVAGLGLGRLRGAPTRPGAIGGRAS